MLNSRIVDIMASCYMYGTVYKGFEKVVYATYLYNMVIVRDASNGLITVTINKGDITHIVTHIFENMTDFRNHVL